MNDVELKIADLELRIKKLEDQVKKKKHSKIYIIVVSLVCLIALVGLVLYMGSVYSDILKNL